MKHETNMYVPEAAAFEGGASSPRPGPIAEKSQEDAFDQALRSHVFRWTGGSSPWAAAQAWQDWGFHLMHSPARLASIMMQGWADFAQIGAGVMTPSSEVAVSRFAPAPDDRRFRDPAWNAAPYSSFEQAHLAAQDLWRNLTAPLPGVQAHHMRRVRFMGNLFLEAISPTNFPTTNPCVQEAMRASGGQCLANGVLNWIDDVMRTSTGQKIWGVDEYQVGRNVGVTPGRVVLRNELMELIQYAPSTPRVHREPILIVPAWIMKYYILDLSPENSLVRYLVAQGFTVFCVSWKNPGPANRETTLDDYRTKGVMAALDAISQIVPNEKVHAAGYCLGGTILAIAAAAMGRDNDNRLASLSVLAAQTAFSEAGELMMFIDESQVSALEDLMSAQGYLDARQMSGAFYALRANEMLWSRFVERYLMGVKVKATDLDAWLADGTRLPARMHSEYLRELFLDNQFAEGNLEVGAGVVAIRDINTPVFAVGAERDHIAPWRSVHKIALFADVETTFVLSGGGHNTAIVSPLGKPKAYYRKHVTGSCANFVDPTEWIDATPYCDGSWWPEWAAWLVTRSASDDVSPPVIGGVGANDFQLEQAPGQYVME